MAVTRTLWTKAALGALLAVGVADWLLVNLSAGPAFFASQRSAPPAVAEPSEVPRAGEPVAAPASSTASPPVQPVEVPTRQSEPGPIASVPRAPAPAVSREALPSPPVATAEMGEPPRAVQGALHFEVHSAALSPESVAMLRATAKAMQAEPGKTVLLEGHADERGPAELNRWLSEQRALAAKAYLLRLGVAPRRVEAVGRGSGAPVDTSGTDEGLARNRRVDLTVR